MYKRQRTVNYKGKAGLEELKRTAIMTAMVLISMKEAMVIMLVTAIIVAVFFLRRRF